MIPRKIKFTICFLTLFCLPGFAQASCNRATAESAKEMVMDAASLIESVGMVTAFRTILNSNSGFVDGDLYLFAINFDGILYLNSIDPSSVGAVILDAQGPDGKQFIREMIQMAKTENEGWYQYPFFDPCSGDIKTKSSYILRMDDYFLGAGYYLEPAS